MDYNESVSLIDSIQAKDTEVRTVVADIYDLGAEISIREYLGIESADLVKGMDKQTEGTKAADEAAKPAAQKPKEKQIKPTAEMLSRINERKREVAKELEEMIKVEAKPKAAEPKVAQEEPEAHKEVLVLPGLSVQDQIRELEKIEIGLDQGVFESIQLEIIRKEIAGLKAAAEATIPADDFQRNLVQIRDSRLNEVSKKLGV